MDLWFLKGKRYLSKVLDVSYGLVFALLLRLYLDNVEYLVGVDISTEKIRKAKRLNLYDEFYVALEVLHRKNPAPFMAQDVSA